MTSANREIVRKAVAKGGWNIIWLAGELPDINEEVELLYEDMDGYPCKCKATFGIIEYGVVPYPCFIGANGREIIGCIAWRKAAT